MKKLIMTIAAIFLTSTLTACGGGGGNSPAGPSYTADFTGSTPAAGEVALKKSSAAGDTVYIDVTAENIINLFGADMKLTIDDTMVTLAGNCTAGALLSGASAYCSQSGSQIVIGVSLASPASPVSGSGVIVTVPLRVTVSGDSAIDFDLSKLYDNGAPTPGEVTVNSWTGGTISGI